MTKTAPLELKDMQGLIVRGYGQLTSACFILIEIEDPGLAKRWLSQIVAEITDGLTKPAQSSFNLAFTHPGLIKLGLASTLRIGFSQEFQEGMVTPHRQRILGDHHDSEPNQWVWGGPQTKSVDLLLMLYAHDPDTLDRLYQTHTRRLAGSGLVEIQKLETQPLSNRKEHFGFHDGITQPILQGLKEAVPENMIAPGEIVLGYLNEYGKYPDSPLVAPASDPQKLLPHQAEGSSEHDFGRNGTYLVFRHLSQDVRGLWKFLEEATREADGRRNSDAAIKLAAKMVGRWPSGAPLVSAPEQEQPALGNMENFSYATTDPYGEKCPVAAHTRRSNPRDSLAPDPKTSTTVSKRHRLLRRGRSYGPPLVEPLEPKNILESDASADRQAERGLYFICLNASLGRQFEFVQQTWINNPKFEGLYWEADPITGDHDFRQKGARGTFTIPGNPVRQRILNLPRFVKVCGGAYFFLPSLPALRYLANLP